MIKFILPVILLLFPALSSTDDIDKGYQAYKNKDYVSAYKHWKISADAGDSISQYNMGLLYYFGNGVEKNLRTAFNYCKKSAEQGLPRAQNNLAHMYSDGLGVKQNYILSYKWSYLAYAGGYPSAKILNKSKEQLDHLELSEGDRLINEYLRRNKNEK